jgi:hypothetical protein
METPRVLTRIGEDVAVLPSDDVTIIFRNILSEGYTTVDKPERGPEPPTGLDIIHYYDIRTTAKIRGKINIRIIIDQEIISKRNRRLWQWNERIKQWTDITKYFNSKYNLIVGETDHLSIFGIT